MDDQNPKSRLTGSTFGTSTVGDVAAASSRRTIYLRPMYRIFLAIAIQAMVACGGAHAQSAITYREGTQPQRIYAFQVRGGQLYVNFWNGTQWSWAYQGAPQNTTASGVPAAITYLDEANKQRIYAFVRGENGHIYVNYWDGGRWRWSGLGSPPGTTLASGSLAAITYYQGDKQRIYLFATGQDGHLYTIYWDGTQWEWADQGRPAAGISVGAPGAITYLDEAGKRRIYTFVRGQNGHLCVNYWDGAEWRWADRGSPPGTTLHSFNSRPAVITYAQGSKQRIYAFVRSNNNRLYVHYWDGVQWRWSNQGTKLISADPAAITYLEGSKQRIYAFIEGADGRLHVNYWDGTQWRWADQGVPAGSSAARGPGGVLTYRESGKRRIYAFVGGTDDHLHVNYWDGARWRWADQGRPLPVTGSYMPELSGLDGVMLSWMTKYGAKAATLAVLKDRKLVYERGFGYQDKNLTGAILPNARMRLATNSMMLSRRALRQLISDNLVGGGELLFEVLNLQPWGTGIYADSRMRQITIQHLIDDKACIADQFPDNKTVGQEMGLGRNATLAERLRYAWTRPSMMLWLCEVGAVPVPNYFSHFAMEFAAQVVATKANAAPMNDNDPTIVGLRYGDYINNRVGQLIGANFFQARNLETEALPKEIWYKSLYNRDPEWNRNWASGQPQVSAAYAIDFFARPGSGTVVAAGRDVARFLKKYWFNGAPKPPSLAGIAWDGGNAYGSLDGTTSIIVDQVWSTGTSRSFVVLVNMRNETIFDSSGKDPSFDELASNIRTRLDAVTTWPTMDLF